MITEKIGEFDIYAKGTLITTDKSLLVLTLGSKGQFKFEFKFEDDKINSETKIEAYKLEVTGIGFKMLNFNNVLGTGNVNVVKIGWLEGRSLYIDYRVFSINDNKGAIVHYQFLQGKKVDNDGNEI